MAAGYYPEDEAGPGLGCALLGILAAGLSVLFLLGAILGPAMVTDVGSLPLTDHAKEAHSGEKWNAASIQSYFSEGGCIPVEYECAAQDFTVQYCEVNAGQSIGLIIGRTVKQIITGFMADTKFWKNRCQ